MKRTTIISFLILVLFSSTYAVNASRLSGDKLNVSAFCCDSTETIMLLGLYGGGFWRSDDGGNSWEAKRHEVAGNAWGFLINDLFMLDSSGDTVIAKVQVDASSGNFWQYTISVDAGDTWRRLYPESSSNHDHQLVIDKNNHSKMMHIDAMSISISEDFGYTWESRTYDPNRNQKTGMVQDPDSSDIFYMSGFAVSPTQPGGVFRSDDYGQTWEPKINPEGLLDYYTAFLSDVKALSNGDIISCLNLGFHNIEWTQYTYENRLIRSTDSGTTWQVEENQLPFEYMPTEIIESVTNPGVILIRGGNRFCVGGMQLYRSTDYGLTFAIVENSPPASIQNISQNKHSGIMYASTGNRGIYHSEDAGLNWTPLDISIDVSMWVACAIKEDIISTSLHGYSDNVVIYNKLDGSYREMGYPDVGRDESFMHHDIIIDDEIYYAFLLKYDFSNETDTLQPLISNNHGETWMPFGECVDYTTNRSETITDLYEGESISRFMHISRVETGYDIAVTSDTGRTWAQSFIEGTSTISSKRMVQNDEAIYFIVRDVGIYVSYTNGETWQPLDHPNVPNVCTSNANLLHNQENGNIFLFGDFSVWEWNGSEWRDCGSSLADAGNLRDIGILPGETPRFLGTITSRNFLWYKNSPEESWERIEFGGEYISELNNLSDPHYDPELDRVYIATHLGLYWFDVAQLDVKDHPITLYPMDYEVLKTYPNPFNTSTKIEFILEQPSEVNLKLYDINGRLVRELLDEKRQVGKHTLNLDGTQLASGTYFLKMDYNHKKVNKKLVLLK